MALMGGGPTWVALGGSAGNFKTVLTKLATDRGYLQEAVKDPRKLLKDYPELTVQELDALRDAAALSGADMSNIDPLHSQLSSARLGSGASLGGNGCCCCCCCGVTGAITKM